MKASYLKAALDYTGVEVKHVFDENCYDANTNTIYLSVLNDTAVGRLIKRALGRPINKNFSLAHELGHAVFEAMDVGSKVKFQNLFGELDDEYQGGTASLIKSAIFGGDEDSFSAYGSYDPEEEFADCFAYLCTHRNKVPGNLSDAVTEKLEYVQKILERIKRSR